MPLVGALIAALGRFAVKPARSRGTIEDVAREAGVSASTASRVLRGVLHVLPETREKIFAAAGRVGYHPNLVARALRTGEVHSAGLVLAARHMEGDTWAAAIAALQRALAPHGLRLAVLVPGDDDNHADAVAELSGWCGVVGLHAELAANHDWHSAGTAPVVLMDPPARWSAGGCAACTVGFDHAGAMRDAVLYLASIGHRNIAYFGGPLGLSQRDLCEEGFRAGMEQACLPVRGEWIFHGSSGRTREESAAALEQALSGSRCRLTALVCASDAIASTVADTARRMGRLVPHAISVIGYGNTVLARFGSPRLTSIELDGQALGQALAGVFLSLCEKTAPPPGDVMVAGRLVQRASTAPRTTFIHRAAEPAPEPPAEGIYEIRAVHSDMVLEVPHNANTAGGFAWQYETLGGVAQLWHITRHDGPWHTIRNLCNWLLLDGHAEVPPILPVILTPAEEVISDIQLWRFEPLEDNPGAFRIVNKAKGLVLDIIHKSLEKSALAIMHPWNGGANQQWTLQPVPVVSGDYELVALHSSMALDVPHGSRASGVAPCQAARRRTLGQRWRLEHRGSAYYTVQSMLSNLVLQAVRLPQPAAILSQQDEENAEAQLWRIEMANPTLPSYRVVNKALGLALEIVSAGDYDGAPAGLAACGPQECRQWLVYDDDAT